MRIGCDEAGKGPVLGSMFAAAVAAPGPESLPSVADSKQLTPARRVDIAQQLRDDPAIEIGLAEVPVDRIDAPQTDMNTLTVTAHAQALQSLSVDSTKVDQVVLDAADPDPERFAARVRMAIDAACPIVARHQADQTDPFVAAASIIAKVNRDDHIDTLRDQYGEIGSGYPSDETTRAFLRSYLIEHGQLPPIARESWATAQELQAAVEQSDLAEFN